MVHGAIMVPAKLLVRAMVSTSSTGKPFFHPTVDTNAVPNHAAGSALVPSLGPSPYSTPLSTARVPNGDDGGANTSPNKRTRFGAFKWK